MFLFHYNELEGIGDSVRAGMGVVMVLLDIAHVLVSLIAIAPR